MSTKLSKEEYQKQKDLEAARKAGTAPPELDEEGNEINPHIPQYIVNAPWYLNTGAPSLKHQRVQDKRDSTSDEQWYARGQRVAQTVTKYRKGACENCGAMSHKTKECMERPRKKGARWTGKDIQADEIVQDVSLDFDAKRDRWNGYNAEEHVQLMKEWELVEEQRKKIKAKKLDEKLKEKAEKDAGKEILDAVDTSSDEESDDEDKYADNADMAGQKVDMKSRQTVRNLRIREDIPKYLRNLDPESAYYDPKTRSMRENPNKEKGPEELDYAGDNFERFTGEAKAMTDTMVFAWQAAERGNQVHLQANPSQAEFLYREFLKKKDEVQEKQKSSILDRYGGEEHLKKPPAELLQQTEEYVEYSRTGKVIKGTERAKAKSKYMEDVHPSNHTSVWGSYWADGQWGYACCHNFVYNSYCAGEAGKRAQAESADFISKLQSAPPQKSLVEQHLEAMADEKAGKKKNKKNKGGDLEPPSGEDQARKRKHVLGEGDVQLSESKLQEALERERKRQRNGRPGHFGDSVDITEEDLEAHRMLRQRHDDPMANYKSELD